MTIATWKSLALRGALIASLLSTGCSSTPEIFDPSRAASMQDAGSVHVAVLSVAPWSDYVRALQPDFQLTADEALRRVTKDTQWRASDSRSAAGVGAESVLLDQPDEGSKLPQKPAAGLLQPPYGAPADPVPTGPPDGHGADDPMDSGVGTDSMLKYASATSLYQEVQVLNRYIRDAAIPAGFRPYMVRLQVSLMPSRRHAPYDAYTTLSFFIPGDRVAPVGSEALISATLLTTSDKIFERPFGNGPKVLPLVVTDNLEASVQSRSFERVRTLLATLLQFPDTSFIEPMYSALVHGALRDQVFGRDLNSLLTVARLSENTMRIRLGAMQEATANFAMVPRNHNITLLLMVPEGAPPLMEVVSRTVLVDTETGENLEPGEELDSTAARRAVLARWKLDTPDEDTLAYLLHALANRNDQVGFSALLRTSLPADHPARGHERSIWIELVSLTMDEQYASNLFELPGQGEDVDGSSELFRNQTVVIEDDGKLASVMLREARFPDFEQILAVLSVKDSDPRILLPASALELDVTRHELQVSFPSLKRWNLTLDEAERANVELKLSWAGQEQTFGARYVEVSPP